MTKKIYVDGIAHLQKAPITASLENVLAIPSLPCTGKNINIFSNKTFQVLIFGKKKPHYRI